MTSQVGFLLIEYLNVPFNSDIICQNQVKLGKLTKQDEKFKKIYFFVVIAMCQVPIRFLLFFKYPFNYLTGQ